MVFFFVLDFILVFVEVIILVWLGKVSVFDVYLMKDFRFYVRSFDLKLFRNKDKIIYIRVIVSVFFREGKVKINVVLKSIIKDDV